jgi:hypothetical protein
LQCGTQDTPGMSDIGGVPYDTSLSIHLPPTLGPASLVNNWGCSQEPLDVWVPFVNFLIFNLEHWTSDFGSVSLLKDIWQCLGTVLLVTVQGVGCCWPLMGRGQRFYSTPCDAQDSPLAQNVTSLKCQ